MDWKEIEGAEVAMVVELGQLVMTNVTTCCDVYL